MDNPRRLMKMRSEDAVDRISKLPDNLQESILERLPIKDAVRTSILSRKWRYIWTVRERLNFGEAFASLIPKFAAKKYVRIIHRILFLHHGPVEYVSLIIPKGVTADFIDLNSWLLILSRKGVQELEIDVFGYLETEVSLCSSLFQCHSLKFLKLSYFELKPPSDFCGFFRLVTLHLLHVTISSDLLSSLISKCKKLENLCLIGTSDCDWQNPKPLVISADNLRTLEYKDDDIRSIISKNLPHIGAIPLGQFVNFSVPLPVVDPKLYSSFDPFISLIGIEKLDLDLPLVKPLDRECPDRLPVILVSLKSLKLYGVRIFKQEDIAFIFCLVRSAPYLETLHIELYQVVKTCSGILLFAADGTICCRMFRSGRKKRKRARQTRQHEGWTEPKFLQVGLCTHV
uniref:F-box domain-containing protein n=2 Tax=Kalanchoe fedtschenkoi TaxID=63787 RepID=A0A7N1A645_KALFE